MIVVWLYLAVPGVCLQLVIVVFPDHTHLLFFILWISPLGYMVKTTLSVFFFVPNVITYKYEIIVNKWYLKQYS